MLWNNNALMNASQKFMAPSKHIWNIKLKWPGIALVSPVGVSCVDFSVTLTLTENDSFCNFIWFKAQEWTQFTVYLVHLTTADSVLHVFWITTHISTKLFSLESQSQYLATKCLIAVQPLVSLWKSTSLTCSRSTLSGERKKWLNY